MASHNITFPAAAGLIVGTAMAAVALFLAQVKPPQLPWVIANLPPVEQAKMPRAVVLLPSAVPPKPPPAPAQPQKPPLPDGALTPAPDPGLIQTVAGMQLPIIGKDGRKPWQVYARPFTDRTARPRIAIIIGGLGLRQATTVRAIAHLPRNVTLAFTPYARDLPTWAARTRLAGHEFLMQIPMEPVAFPTNDPGPKALMVQNSPSENTARLDWTMSRAPGFIGLLTYMGSRFTADSVVVRPFITEMQDRGLMVVDSGTADHSVVTGLATAASVPNATVTRLIDGAPTKAAIESRLAELERYAASNGYAIGLGSDYPSTIEQIQSWSLGLEARGFVLAPVSALADVTRAHATTHHPLEATITTTSTQHPAAQQPTAQHPAAQHPTAQHRTAQHPSLPQPGTSRPPAPDLEAGHMSTPVPGPASSPMPSPEIGQDAAGHQPPAH